MLNDKGLKKLEHALQGNEALAREVIGMIAFSINDHDDLRRLLGTVKRKDRQTAYDTLRPMLNFQAKPLDVYLSELGTTAEREQLPELDSVTGALRGFKVGEVGKRAIESAMYDGGVGVLTCRRCTTFDSFPADTPVQSRILAVQAGWRRETDTDTWLCPGCNDLRKEN